ncbi:hypothetical protein HT031_004268 [Scenedesmus sp. PABB004]|nr:hypothetical protein HT031_004268 [Scenedesmus sp. PABB004]
MLQRARALGPARRVPAAPRGSGGSGGGRPVPRVRGAPRLGAPRAAAAAGAQQRAPLRASAPGDGDGDGEPRPPERRLGAGGGAGTDRGGPDGGGGGGEGGGPQPPRLPPQVRRVLALLTQYGGVYGTAAVALGWATHVDAFGGAHWDASDVASGLRTFLPLLLLDAALMLPDYSVGPEDSQEVAATFFGDPDALRNWGAAPQSAEEAPGGEAAPGSAGVAAGGTGPAVDGAAPPAPGGGGGGSLLLRGRMALELMQQVYTRANPGIGLSPLAEFGVVVIAVLADEMLYRAVGLTLLGLWLRDRLYEAGWDETVALGDWGSALAGVPELPTPEFARWAAVALVAALGVAGFAAGALREVESVKRLQVLDKDGSASEASEALKAQLVASLGSQNVVMYGLEGLREVSASVMAGAAFVSTGNLAAPLAGSLLVQTLFSIYQRLSLQRGRAKRRAMLERMKARSEKLQAAMAAAVAAKRAGAPAAEPSPAAVEPAAVPAAASSGDGEAAASSAKDDDGSGSGSSKEGKDFLTLVLEAAAEQEALEKQQRMERERARVAAAAAAAAEAAAPPPPAASSSSGAEASSSAAEPGAGGAEASSSGAEAEAARQQLSVLLEDMLRSPEGTRVVEKWMAGAGGGAGSAAASSAGGGDGDGTMASAAGAKDPRAAVDQLLADPATKAKLLAELEEQLCGMAAAAARREEQERSR